MVIGQPLTRKLEFLGRFDGVAIVVAQNPLSIRFMQCQRIADAVRNTDSDRDSPRFDFDPIAALLVYGVAVKIQKGFESGISLHDLLYHQMINIVCRLKKNSRGSQ